jgi:hypothetical protein
MAGPARLHRPDREAGGRMTAKPTRLAGKG